MDGKFEFQTQLSETYLSEKTVISYIGLSASQYPYRAISKWKIWRQCYGESKNSAFVDSLPNELYTKPYCDKMQR